MKRDEMYAKLDTVIDADAEQQQRLTDALWVENGRACAVVVADMSGFTRITRESGIIAFLMEFRRAVRSASECFRMHRPHAFKTAADNLIAVFDSVDDGVRAALALAAIKLPRSQLCLGVGYGRILLLDDDFFGDEVNVAYKLGEDIAEGGEILLSEAVMRSVNHSVFAGRNVEGPREVNTGNTVLRYHRVGPVEQTQLQRDGE